MNARDNVTGAASDGRACIDGAWRIILILIVTITPVAVAEGAVFAAVIETHLQSRTTMVNLDHNIVHFNHMASKA